MKEISTSQNEKEGKVGERLVWGPFTRFQLQCAVKTRSWPHRSETAAPAIGSTPQPANKSLSVTKLQDMM